MSLIVISQAKNILPHLFVILLLGLSYFNYFLISKPVCFFLEISSLIGKVLVNKFLAICNFTLEMFELTYTFSQILREDSLIFLKDAIEKLAFAVYLLKEFYHFLQGIGWNIITKFFHVFKTFFDFFEFMYYSVAMFKQVICDIGSAIWCYVISILETVVLFTNGIITFVKNTFNEITNINKLWERLVQSIKNIYSFLFDIPPDSVYGLIIGAVVVVILFIKFKDICYFLSNVIFKLYQQIISFGINFWSGKFLEKKALGSVDYDNEDDERLCVICQCHLKEIILFPCKHLCLCLDCSSQLITNQPICPICRCNVIETFKVYM